MSLYNHTEPQAYVKKSDNVIYVQGETEDILNEESGDGTVHGMDTLSDCKSWN